MRKLSQLFALAVFAAGVSLAQDELPRVAFNIGAGFTSPVYSAGERLNPGWNVGAGIGYNFHPNFALMADFKYNNFGVNTGTLNSLGFPGGSVHLWSATLNPVVKLNPRGPVGVYFTGGGGFYQWRQQFTAPTTATFTGFDPYFGIVYPVAVPVNQVLSSYTLNKPGWNGGMGLTFGTRWHAKAFAEARFNRMILGNDRYVDTLPVTFGLRW